MLEDLFDEVIEEVRKILNEVIKDAEEIPDLMEYRRYLWKEHRKIRTEYKKRGDEG